MVRKEMREQATTTENTYRLSNRLSDEGGKKA
jgi:hypothetical protein